MHDYAARVMGAGFLALGITSGRANNCHTEDDKKSVLLSHGLVSCFTFTSELYTQVFLVVMIFLKRFLLVLSLNAFFVFYDRPMEFSS